MHQIKTAIAGILALFVASAAIAQTFPTVPAQSVIGRLGTPGSTGPSQAIPFATLQSQLGQVNSFTQQGAGAVLVPQSLINNRLMFPEMFGAVGDGVADDTAAIQRWINAGALYGKELLASPGTKYRLTENGTNCYAILIDKSVQIRGLGVASSGVAKAWFFVDPGVRSCVDTFRIRGAAPNVADNTVLENLHIGNGTSAVGRSQIFIDTTGGGHELGWPRFINLALDKTASGWVFQQDNSDGVDTTGGMYLATIQGGNFRGGMNFIRTGSGHRVDHVAVNVVNTSGFALQYEQIAGGAPSTFTNNLFADGAGAVKFRSGRNIVFTNNSVESNGTQPGSNGAVVDFAGDVATLISPTISGNYFGNLSSSASALYNLRIGDVLNATIGDGNSYTTTNATQIASGYWIANGGTQTVIAAQGYQTDVIPDARHVLKSTTPNEVVYANPSISLAQLPSIPTGTILSNVSGVTAPPAGRTLGVLMADYFGNTPGVITLTNGAGAWATGTLGTLMSTYFGNSANLTTFTDGAGAWTAGTLPVAAGGTGRSTLGTGVATALGVNVGSAGAFVANGGAGGTPSSIVLTNATGTAASLTAGTASAAPASGLTGSTLAAGVTASSLTSLGTVASLTATDLHVTNIANLSGTLQVGPNGTGTAAAYINVYGGSGSGGGGSFQFGGNSVPSFALGNHSASFGGLVKDMVIYNFTGSKTAIQIVDNTAQTTFPGANIAATSATTGSVVVTNGLGVSGAIWAGTYVSTTPTTVGALPTCNAGTKGARMFVTDANATTFLSAVAAGGANNVPVVCDATSWKIGANDNLPLYFVRKFA